jgi:catechol 2,3-dioxygenase-like lactoylglutathione lyase family enzyme
VPTATIDELTLADEPERWAQLGFAVADGACRIGAVTLRFVGADAGQGIVGWSLREIRETELDGLPTAISERPIPSDDPPEHPNGVIAIDHVVAFTPDFARSVAALQEAGLDLRRIREQPTPAGAPRQAFFRLGDEILELVQTPDELVPDDAAAAQPTRFWGLALRVADLDHTVAQLDPHAGEARPAVQPGRRIASVRRSAGLAIPLALMSPAEQAVTPR